MLEIVETHFHKPQEYSERKGTSNHYLTVTQFGMPAEGRISHFIQSS